MRASVETQRNKLATTVALRMAAIAPPQLEVRTLNLEYATASLSMDVKAEGQPGTDYTTAGSSASTAIEQAGDLGEAVLGRGAMEEDNVEEEEVAKLPKRRRKESDAEIVEEDMSDPEGSSEEEDTHDSDKDSSDAETPSAKTWWKHQRESVDASVDVASRNNCVLVFHSCLKSCKS